MRNFKVKPFYLTDEDLKWVEETFSSMTQEEKLNQVFVDMLWNNPPKEVKKLQEGYQLGGFRYNNSTPEKLWEQNKTIQESSKIPALIAANVEAGGNGAVKGGTKLGEGVACGATNDPTSAYYMGKYGCREAKTIGCNWTFAPIVDIDFNWRNCVIATRAFGNNPDLVLNMGLEYMKGAHEEGVACCMKHFPGDGLDERDQHLVTTVNTLSVEDWDKSFGKVYKGMIDAGVPSVMVGHIQLPSYSRVLRPGIKDEEIMPATVAPELLQDLLRDKLGFNGLVITDATHMVGITGKVRRHDSIPQMIMAGCDMILYYRNHDEDVGFLKEAVEDGRLTQERLDEAVKTVLAFKAHLKLHIKQKEGTLVPSKEGLSVIGCKEHKEKAKEIIDKSITLVKNTKNQLPLNPSKHKKVIIYYLATGGFMSKIKDMIFGNKAKKPTDILIEELKKEGFEPTLFKLNYLKYLSPKGINGKKAIAEYSTQEFASMYDAAIILCNIGSFSTTNERSIHWSIPMGPEIPWYATEMPTVAISLSHPFHLIDLAMVPTYINTYNPSEETIKQTVQKLIGKSEFKGVSPVDAFCDMWDTKL